MPGLAVMAKEAEQIYYTEQRPEKTYSLPQLMDMDVNTALTSLRRTGAGCASGWRCCRSWALDT